MANEETPEAKTWIEEHSISDESREMTRRLMCTYDRDGNGYIDAKEFEECLQFLGFRPTEEDLNFLMKHLDKNNDGKLDIDAIVANFEVINAHSVSGRDLMEAFKKFDMNGDGYIRSMELVAILSSPVSKHAMSVSEARKFVRELMEKYDTNKDGVFTYAEFVNLYMGDALQMTEKSQEIQEGEEEN